MSGKTSIAVLGGGSWGTALAHLLAHAGHSVALLLRDTEQAAHINAHHENPRYLRGVPLHPGIRLLPGIRAVRNRRKCWRVSPFWSCRCPCQASGGRFCRLAGCCAPDCVLVNTAKGIEVSELVTVERMVREELPGFVDRYAVLSGPSFALEVATCKPTAVVLGCRDERLGARLREVFATPWFRSYSSTDVPGVELGGAIKNVIAIAAGLSDGLGFGLNAGRRWSRGALRKPAALVWRLGRGRRPSWAFPGSGISCSTVRAICPATVQVGLRLGAGESLEDIASSMCMVAEGVKTTQAVHRLAQRLGVDMPVTGTMYSVLYEGFAPREAVQALMGRQLKEE